MKTKLMMAAVAALLAAPVIAQQDAPPAEGGRGSWRGGDMNQPMKRADVEERTKARFQRMDANGDGALSGDELRGPMASMMDTNGDGKVTLDEMVKAALARFDIADANKDGIVTPDEREAARALMPRPQ